MGTAYILPPLAPMGLSLASLLLFTVKGEVKYFLLFFFLLLFVSDSRQEIFLFAKDAKTYAALLLPINFLFVYRRVKYSSHFLPHIAVFLIVAWITLLWADNPTYAFQKTLSYTFIFTMIPALFIYCVQDDLSFVKDLFSLFTSLLLIGLALKFVRPEFVIMEKNGRFTGLLGNPNGLGIFITLVFAYFQILRRTNITEFSRQELIIFYLVFFVSLYYSKSRTAMMTVIIFYALNLVYNYSHFIGWITFIVIGYLYEFILEGIPIVTDFLGFSEDLRVENVDKIKRGSGRDIAWKFAWDQISKDMFLGHGVSATEELFVKNYKNLSILGHEGNAHNTYLTVWYDTGLVGLVTFLGGIITYFIKVSKEMSFVMPILFSVAFSINYESWLSASLNPFSSMFLIIATLLGMITIDTIMTSKEDSDEYTDEAVSTS